MQTELNLVYLRSALALLPDAHATLKNANYKLFAVDDVSGAISIAREVSPDIILLDAVASVAEFAQFNLLINKNPAFSATCRILFDYTVQEYSTITIDHGRYFRVPAPSSTKELLACLRAHCEQSNPREDLTDKDLPLNESLAYYKNELQQSKFTERSLARQLWQERERLATSQAVARTGSWVTDLCNMTVKWTEETHRIFGTDPTRFQPTHEKFLAFVHPADRSRVESAFSDSLSNTNTHLITHRIVRPDGQQRTVEESWGSFTNGNGVIDRTVGACRDITEQRRAEEDRDRLFRYSGDLLAITSFDGLLTQVNPAWTSILGWQKEQIENSQVLGLIHADDQAKSEQALTRLGFGESIMDFENRFVCADGSFRWISWNCYGLRDSEQIFATGRDITARKVAEKELRELEARLKFMLDNANMGYWDFDVENNQAWRSLSFDRCYGYQEKQESWDQETFTRQIHPDDRDYVIGAFLAARSTHEAYRLEFRVIWPDQTVHWLFSTGRFTQNAAGKIVRVTGIVLDISDRKLLEEQLRQAQRLESMGQLTGGIAHDFNNLLTVIIGNAEVLKDELANNKELQPIADMVLSAADRGSELIKRMLAFARKQRLEPKTINSNALLETLLPLLQRSLGEHISIELHLEKNLWLCRIDPTELESSVLNLCINARDAMSKRGNLTIATSNQTLKADDLTQRTDLTDGDFVRITVEDEGIGMSDEILAQIFEPFYTTKAGGSGLGLAMVYGFIKQSGGHIYVTSVQQQGTRIDLYIPAVIESA